MPAKVSAVSPDWLMAMESVLFQNRFTVSELRSNFGVRRYAQVAFKQILAVKTSMPRSSSRLHDNSPEGNQLRWRHREFLKRRWVLTFAAKSNDFPEPLRLLVNLLEHESWEATSIFFGDFPLNSVNGDSSFHAFQVENPNLGLGDQSEFAVVQQDDLLRYRQDRVQVRADTGFIVSDSYQQG
jgi:hypothetical protein